MSEKTMRDAINEALHQAMAADDSVFVIGEDVAPTAQWVAPAEYSA